MRELEVQMVPLIQVDHNRGARGHGNGGLSAGASAMQAPGNLGAAKEGRRTGGHSDSIPEAVCTIDCGHEFYQFKNGVRLASSSEYVSSEPLPARVVIGTSAIDSP